MCNFVLQFRKVEWVWASEAQTDGRHSERRWTGPEPPQHIPRQPRLALGGPLCYLQQASEYPTGILAMLSTQLKKHLEECNSIRLAIMGPLRAGFVNTQLMSFWRVYRPGHALPRSGPSDGSAGSQDTALPPTANTPFLLLEHERMGHVSKQITALKDCEMALKVYRSDQQETIAGG